MNAVTPNKRTDRRNKVSPKPGKLLDGPQEEKKFLQPSKTLSARQKEIFNSIVRSFPAGSLVEADRYVLEAFTRVVHLNEIGAQRLETEGAFNATKKIEGMRKATVEIFLRTSTTLATMAARLRASPQSRTTKGSAGADADEENEGAEAASFLSSLQSEFKT